MGQLSPRNFEHCIANTLLVKALLVIIYIYDSREIWPEGRAIKLQGKAP